MSEFQATSTSMPTHSKLQQKVHWVQQDILQRRMLCLSQGEKHLCKVEAMRKVWCDLGSEGTPKEGKECSCMPKEYDFVLKCLYFVLNVQNFVYACIFVQNVHNSPKSS